MSIREEIKNSGIILVGLTGRKGSGKSTFAKRLGADFPWHVSLAFADPIRTIAFTVFGSTYSTHEEKDAVDSYWAEKLGDDWSTGRRILQRLGTETFRNGISEDIWLHVMERRLMALLSKIKGSSHPRPLVTIDDCRFKNEAVMVREMGGKVIRMVNPNSPANADPHPSEAGIPDDLVDHTYDVSTEEDVARLAKAFSFCMLR